MGGNSWQYPYTTGWVDPNSDWTNRHLGSKSTVDSYVAHMLNAYLPDLLLKLFVSSATAGAAEADCFEVIASYTGAAGPWMVGWQVNSIDANNILFHTAANGIFTLDTAGVGVLLQAQPWRYKIKVWYIG